MTLPKLGPIFFAILLGLGSPYAGAETYYGVRNEKCAASAEDAKAQVIERLGADRKLCDGIGGAAQVGGWSCHAGSGGCPKSKFRCNTQYRCARTVSAEGVPVATVPSAVSTPIGSPTVSAPLPGVGFPTHPPTPFPTVPPVAATPTAKPTVVPVPAPSAAPNPTPTAVPAAVPTPTATPTFPNPNAGTVIPNPTLNFKPKVLTP